MILLTAVPLHYSFQVCALFLSEAQEPFEAVAPVRMTGTLIGVLHVLRVTCLLAMAVNGCLNVAATLATLVQAIARLQCAK